MPKRAALFFLAIAIYSGMNAGYGSSLKVDGYDRKGYFISPTSNCLIVDLSENTVYPKRLLKGESVCVSPSVAENFLKEVNASLIFTETIEDCVCDYYYSGQIPLYTSVNGRKINAHIARRGERITLGVPFIFGSY